MKKTNEKTILILLAVLILGVFTGVIASNLLPDNKHSNSYFVKVEDDMGAKIESMVIDDGNLIITTSGDAKSYCVKSTKSTPAANALCWKDINDNTASISIYNYKKYYVWIKDINGNISIPMSINTNEK